MTRPFRDADEADVFAAFKRPGSGAARAQAEGERAMRERDAARAAGKEPIPDSPFPWWLLPFYRL
jgi:hypothetical protein